MGDRTIGMGRAGAACARGMALALGATVALLPAVAAAQMSPEALVAAGLRVQAVRYNVNATGDGMIWFQLANRSGASWHVTGIRCEIYDRGGSLIFEQSFPLSLEIDAPTTMRETDGFVVNKFPRDFKSGCFIEKATRR